MTVAPVIANALALAGINLWTGALVVAHLVRLKGDNWETNTLSHYLTGRDGTAVDAGFYALAVGLIALAATVSLWPAVFFLIGAAGTVGAAITRAVWPDTPWHIRSAGLAFGGIGVADILASLGHPAMLVLAGLAPAVAIATVATRSDSAIQEKSVAVLYVAWVGAVTVSRLTGHPML